MEMAKIQNVPIDEDALKKILDSKFQQSQEIKKALRLERAIECLSQFGKVERADDSDSYVLSIVALESYKDKLREVQGEIVFPTKEILIRFSESISKQALSSNQTLKEIFLEQLNFLLNDQLLNNDSAENINADSA